MTKSEEATEERLRVINHYFDWYRVRIRNLLRINEVDDSEVEQHVLIAAGLDSLAKRWGKLFNSDKFNRNVFRSDSRLRFGEFLSRHGGSDVFKKVSGPEVVARALTKFSAEVPQLKKLTNPLVESQVRVWQDDPDLQALTAACKTQNLGPDEGWLRQSRYGELLYEKYRNSWLHNLWGSNDLVTRQFSSYTDEPHYENTLFLDPVHSEFAFAHVTQRPVFTSTFMTRTYSHAIASFERECLDRVESLSVASFS